MDIFLESDVELDNDAIVAQIQKIIDGAIAKIDEKTAAKEAHIMKI